MEVEFIVPGYAMGKQRPRFVRRGKYVSTYTPQKTHSYQEKVQQSYLEVTGGRMLDGAIKAEICAIYETPKSYSKKKAQKAKEDGYMKKPDADNIAKSILDGLNEVAFSDDAHVDDLHVWKMYGDEEKCMVRLSDNKHAVSPLIFFNDQGGIIE